MGDKRTGPVPTLLLDAGRRIIQVNESMPTFYQWLLMPGLFLGIAGCDSGSSLECPLGGASRNSIENVSVTPNPFGVAPLTALVTVTTRERSQVRVVVKGQRGNASDVTLHEATCNSRHVIPVLGLYADYANRVEINVLNANRPTITQTLTMRTEPLPSTYPQFEIIEDYDSEEPAYFLVNSVVPLIVDRYGDVRWYLDIPEQKYGLQRLANGHFAFGLTKEARIDEYTVLGELLGSWYVPPEFRDIHHDVYEMESGNLLVTVNRTDGDTSEDVIIEIDRTTGALATVWDLREVLPRRTTFIHDDHDWFHANAVIEDRRDGTIIVSGQRQGLVKLTKNNELRWILAPPDGWDGVEEYVLTRAGSGDFDWPWGQHAPALLPNGDLLVFDNGFGRDYGSAARYSRLVQYRITEREGGGGTVEQVWQYGKERGDELYSPIVSDVDFVTDSRTILGTWGALAFDLIYVSPDETSFELSEQPEISRIIEVDYEGRVLFEMSVRLREPATPYVYRSEKLRSISIR